MQLLRVNGCDNSHRLHKSEQSSSAAVGPGLERSRPRRVPSPERLRRARVGWRATTVGSRETSVGSRGWWRVTVGGVRDPRAGGSRCASRSPRGARVDRPGRAELRDRAHGSRAVAGRVGQAGALLAEHQHAALAAARTSRAAPTPGRLSMPRAAGPRAVAQATRSAIVGVVPDVLVAVGDHRPAAVPPPPADDVHLGGQERVGVAHDRADVEVVLPVLDGDVERVPALVEVGDDRLARQ